MVQIQPAQGTLVGPLGQSPELEAIVRAIVSKDMHFQLPDGTHLRTRVLADGECLAVDYKGLRYLEQNRRLSTTAAERARRGAVIVWVLRTQTNQGTPLTRPQTIGRIEDGLIRRK